jgi:hypothetical protein
MYGIKLDPVFSALDADPQFKDLVGTSPAWHCVLLSQRGMRGEPGRYRQSAIELLKKST